MTTRAVDEQTNTTLKSGLRAAYARVADNTALPLVMASLAIGWLAWELFFHFSEWIWARQFHVDMATINSWQRNQLSITDGVEPEAMLGLALVTTVLFGLLAHLLLRTGRSLRVFILVVSSCCAWFLFLRAGFHMPLTDVAPGHARPLMVIAVSIATSLLLGWGPPSRHSWSVVTALLLIPVAFVPAVPPSIGDAMTILSPGLRLMHGVAPASVYMQYDYLAALVAKGWLQLGGDPSAIFFFAGVSYYALLISLPVLTRRWFSNPGLIGPLLVSIILIRMYASMGDPVTIPQVAPFRLDLWILPVGLALYRGVRHWAVALALGLLCLFSRSTGVLYLGGYALAFSADFLAVRLALNQAARPPLRQELNAFLRAAAPNVGIIIGCLALTTWWLGSPVSETAILYHKLGVGQWRMPGSSFYWWLLPVTALSGALAFWKRSEWGEKRGGAMLLAVGLLIAGSVYFFGRSHDNNLCNLSVHFLLCFFLSFDILLGEPRSGGRSTLKWQIMLSSALLSLCAFQYSGRIWTKVAAQISVMSRAQGSDSLVFPHLGSMYCDEVAASAPDKKVYFFNGIDFFYYLQCNYAPPTYLQPMGYAIVKAPLLAELADLLDRGYTIAIFKGDSLSPYFESDFAADLSADRVLLRTESSHYNFVKRGPDPEKVAPPRRRRRRPAPATP